MKNTKENKILWVLKVNDIMMMGGKSDCTFQNYKCHINRFLNFYDENIDINKLDEEKILSYIKKEYL